MTPSFIQQKLASGATPYLLTPKEAGMSDGPWFSQELVDGSFDVCCHGLQDVCKHRKFVCEDCKEPTARFIAATNGERPWAEGQWSDYLTFCVVASDYIRAQNFEQGAEMKAWANAILQRLDDSGRLGWREKGGGL